MAPKLGPIGATASAASMALGGLHNTTVEFSYNGNETTNAPRYANAPTTATTETALSVDERLMDAKLEAVEARTDAKFAEVMGELRVISSALTSLDGKVGSLENNTKTLKFHILGGSIGIGVALAGLVIGFFAWGTQILELAAGIFGAGAGAGVAQ